MKKLRAASLSPNADLPLSEHVLYAPRRWDRMTASERKLVEEAHRTTVQTGLRRDGNDKWGVGRLKWDNRSGDYMAHHPFAWWPRDAPGFVTAKPGRSDFAAGLWTVVVAAYTKRQAHQLASLGEWAPDTLTPGILKMVHSDGTVARHP